MRVAIVIPVRGHFGYARLAVRTALENTPDPLVILVDDASPGWRDRDWKFPAERFLLHRFKKNRGLSAAWNAGLVLARNAGAEAAVATNSDVLFPPGWWPPLEKELLPGRLLGPITNAPGHRRRQQVLRFLPDYKLTDDMKYLAKVQARLTKEQSGKLIFDRINGFCMAARIDDWFRFACAPDTVFNPRYPMNRNEDELQGRWRKSGGKTVIVPASCVFHYRGVTRNAIRGKTGFGWYRKRK